MADPQTANRLVCVECEECSDGKARGWRVFLNEDGDPVAYCPTCAEREFGDD